MGYRSTGHGFFFEDGTEVNNILDRNLAVQALPGKPLPLQVLAFDTNDAAGFWWANCLNAFTRNVAADCGKFGYRFQMVKTPTFSPELLVLMPNGKRRQVDVRTLPFIRFDQNEAHSQRRFAFNLGGFHGQSETEDLDRDGNVIDRSAYLGGDVQGVGPDYKHPFRIKDYLVWASHWGFHSTAPNVQIQGFTAHDVNYLVWRSNVAGHDYNGVDATDIHVSTFFNGFGTSPTREEQLRYVDPKDDTPPVTLITQTEWLDNHRVRVSGVAVDDDQVREVKVNGEAATLQAGPVTEWSQLLLAGEMGIEVSVAATDASGNVEAIPQRMKLSRSGASPLPASPVTSAVSSATPAMMAPAYGPAAIVETRDEPFDTKALPWPLWDGKESTADYARRTQLEATRFLQLGGQTLELVLIPAGRFLMGSAPGEVGADGDETPRHRVVISRPFYLGKYELTQAQYEAVTGKNPSYFPAPSKPVEQVSWQDAQDFLAKAGQGLRLPTEAEWEFACRAGSETAYQNGDTAAKLSECGWWGHSSGEGKYGNAPSGTTEVGKLAPNRFGLYDMHGNVYEWCADIYAPAYYRESPVLDPSGPAQGDERVLRGGCWEADASKARAANRNGFSPKSHGYLLGFRVAMPVAP